jgi:hypothetical protein
VRLLSPISGGLIGLLLGATAGITTKQARTAAPAAITSGAASEGTSLAFARADHQHGTATSLTSTGTVTSNANPGTAAFAVTQNGAWVDFGAGGEDHATSDGNIITFHAPITSAVGSGNAYSVEANGARYDFGSGAEDYAVSDGETVTIPGPVTFGPGPLGGLSVASDGDVGLGSGTASTITLSPSNCLNTYDTSTCKWDVLAASGSVTIGSGTAILKHLSATASLDFDLSGAGITCQTLTVTVTGAADGDSVGLGIPNALASSTGVLFTGWVSAANTVSVKACDVTSANPNPAAATVRADVWQH